MLPSFRLVALTFLCSFVLVYAGLRLVAPARVAGQPADERAALQRGGAGASEWRQADLSVPVIFDMRFGAGEPPAAVPASLTLYAIDRAIRIAPDEPPLAEAVPAPIPAALAPAVVAPTTEPDAIPVRPEIETPPEPTAPLSQAPALVPLLLPAVSPPQEAAPPDVEPFATTGVAPARARTQDARMEEPKAEKPARQIAALPEPAAPAGEPAPVADDFTASIAIEERKPPVGVANPGVSQPVAPAANPHTAKPKAVRKARRAKKSRTPRGTATPKQETPAAAAPTNPFTTLFAGPQ